MKFLIRFILFNLIPFLSFTQTNKAIDELSIQLVNHSTQDTSRVNILLKIAAANYGINPQKMQKAAEEAIQISDKLHFKKGLAEGYKLMGAIFYSTADYSKAENYYIISLKKFQELNQPHGIIICYNNLGGVALVQTKYTEALQYYQNSIRIAEKAKLPRLAGLAYSNVGIIYSELKKYNLALERFQNALEMHVTANYLEGIAAALSNIGNVYNNIKDYENASVYFEKALLKNIEIDSKIGMAREYGNLGAVYSAKKEFERSGDYYYKALKINEDIGNKKGLAVNTSGLGEYYLRQNNLSKALIYNQKALCIAKEIRTKDVQRNILYNLSEIHEKLNNTDSAYYYFKAYFETKESIDNENNRKELTRLELQYEFETKEEKYRNQQLLDAENLKQQQLLLALNSTQLKVSNNERDLVKLKFLSTQANLKAEQLEGISRGKQLEVAENEVKLRKNEIEIAELNLAAKQKQHWYFISGLLLLAIIGSLLFYQRNTSIKANTKLKILNAQLDEANQTKVRFLGMLNHDLRSPVANLLHFLQLQKDAPEILDESSKARLQERTMVGIENLLASMEDILLWSKGQMQYFKPEFKTLEVDSLFEDLKKHFANTGKVMVSYQNPQHIMFCSDINYIKTIMRNLTQNALKVSAKTQNPQIEWKAWQDKEIVYLSISDNGEGATEGKFKALYNDTEVSGINTGFGLHLIRDLAKAIDCEISVNSSLGIGTIFVLKFKLSL